MSATIAETIERAYTAKSEQTPQTPAQQPAATKAPAETPTPAKTQPKGFLDAFAPKDEAPETPAVVEDNDAPPDKASNWKAMKQKHAAELAEIKAQAEKFKLDHDTLAAKYKDYDTILEERRSLAEKIKILDFKNSPDYNESFVKPQLTAKSAMMEALKVAGKTADVNAILALPPEERFKAADELIKDLPTLARTRFERSFFEFSELEAKERDALSNADKVKAEWEQKHLSRRAKEIEQDRQQFSAVISETLGKLPSNIEPPEGASEEEVARIQAYNKAVSEAASEAEKVAFSKMDTKGVAQVAATAGVGRILSSYVVPNMVATIQSQQKVIAELNAKLDAIKKSSPGYSDASAPSDGSGVRLTNEQLIAKRFGG